MEEKVYEMEYIINGEKYIITCTKVEEESVITTTNDNDVEIAVDSEVMDGGIQFSIEDIPVGMDIKTWLNIIEKFGIILTK